MPVVEDIKKRRSGSAYVVTNKTFVFCFDGPIGEWGNLEIIDVTRYRISYIIIESLLLTIYLDFL